MKGTYFLTKVLAASILTFGIGSQAQESSPAQSPNQGQKQEAINQSISQWLQKSQQKNQDPSQQEPDTARQAVGIDHTGVWNLEALLCADTFTGELTDLAAFRRGSERITIVGNNYTSRENYRDCTARSRAQIFFNTNDTYDFVNHQYTSVTNGSCRVGLELADRPVNQITPRTATRRVATGQNIPNFNNEYFSSVAAGILLVDVDVENFQTPNPDVVCSKLYLREEES